MNRNLINQLSRPLHTTSAFVAMLFLLALTAGGCFWVTTKHEGKKIQKSVKDIEVRVTNYEGSLESKLKKLELVLGKATNLLTRNSANLGADVDTLRSDMRQMRGLLSAAKKLSDDARTDVRKLNTAVAEKLSTVASRIDSIDIRLQGLEKTAANPPKKAGDYYRDGMAAFNASKWADATAAFRALVIRFPHHGRADDAQYYRAESRYRAKDYAKAIREFQKQFEKFPQSKWADDSMYRAAQAAEKQKRCRVARAYLAVLRKRYKRSPFSKRALAKAKKLKRYSRNKRYCVK